MAAVMSVTTGAAPRVDLMPKAEIERRARSALAARWAVVLLTALAVVFAASAVTFWLQLSAAQRLVVADLRTTELLQQIAALSDVQDALALESDLVGFRADAMATDIRWSSLFATLQSTMPEGVAITGFSLAPGGIPQGGDAASSTGLSGTLELTSATVADIVPLIRAVRPLPGVISVDGLSSVAIDGRYDYTLRIELDQSVYTGAYAQESE